MKNILIALFFLVFSITQLRAGVHILEGVYQGKDVYIQNPFSDEGVGFCIYEVLVNGLVTSDEVNSSAFAVDLSMYEFSNGDEVIITIRSKADCSPRIINPEAISPTSSCEFSDIQLKSNGDLAWVTKGENGKIPFIIEHFKWNKWVQIGSVLGNGTPDKSEYTVSINLPAGANELRLKQKDYSGETLSKSVKVQSGGSQVALVSDKVNEQLEFTGITHYELFNSFGEVVQTGFDKTVDMSSFEKGYYYLNFEKTPGKEIKKR